MFSIRDLEEQLNIDGNIRVKEITENELKDVCRVEYGSLYKIPELYRNAEIVYMYADSDELILEVKCE